MQKHFATVPRLVELSTLGAVFTFLITATLGSYAVDGA